MTKKSPGACHCARRMPIGCINPITQEDLLCDDCRDGCNAVFSASSLDRVFEIRLGHHLKTSVTVRPGETL